MSRKKTKMQFGKPKNVAEKFVKNHSHLGYTKDKLKELGVEFPCRSASTGVSYIEGLTNVQSHIRDAWKKGRAREGFPGGLTSLTKEFAEQYLEERREQNLGQKTLDRDRQALQFALQKKLDRVYSNQGEKGELAQATRAISHTQMKVIASGQSEKNALATELSFTSGIRQHEFYSLRRVGEGKPESQRNWDQNRFAGKHGEYVSYLVTGKGGLIRIVLVRSDLSERLETLRLDQPKNVIDRGIKYSDVRYGIGAGTNWARSFSRSSNKHLGWSTGAHGLRHSFAQNRMEETQKAGISFDQALGATASELGHFNVKTTLTYLR